MSYYRGSMSIRGRGASFRGNSYRGTSNYRGGNSYRGSNSYGDRGGYSSGSSRGGRYHSSNNSYSTGYQDSRSRYNNATEKYNSRGRDDGYRRSSYRGDEQYSGSRDHSRGSPDRKRMRTDQGSSSRRSNDGGYNPSGADSYNNQRYESSSYGVERRYSSERHVRSPKDFRPRNDGPSMYNKASDSTSMPPPRSRGSFRGRMTSRGIRGRGSIRRIEPFARKRISELYVKRRNIPRSIDYARRLKIQKMRSTVKKRDSASSNESEKEDWDAEMEELEKKKNAEDKESSPKKVSPKKEKPEKKASGDEASDKEDNTGSGDEAQLEEEESEKEESEEQESKSKEISRNRFNGRSSFIKLICCHCTVKCITFKEYILHLRSPRHTNSMRRLALKQKGQLARMRLFQRNAQRDIDEKNKDIPGLRTQFCPLCKLNYRQLKSKHQMSEAHRDMKKFLMPYCRICKITFKSPMLYEAHMCSLDHLKRKARVDYFKSSKMEIDEQVSGEEDECIKELDLDNFMTLDSVGDVDDVDDEEEDQENEEGDKKDSSENEKGKTPKTEINVGNEHVRKVELYYCDLCKIYLPRNEEPELSLKKHCRTRSHLKKYVRYRDDKALRREAERIHRKNQEAKEAKEKEAEKADESNALTPKKEKDANAVVLDDSTASGGQALENGSLDEEDAGDDKLWADVDKDLGELLREVEPNKSSDDEDDSRATSVRYDRFRYSDKKGGADEKGKTQSDDMKDSDQAVIAENSDNVKTEEK